MKRRAFLAALASPLLAHAVARLDGQRVNGPINLVFEGDSLTNGSGLAPAGCNTTNACPDAWPNQLLSELRGQDMAYRSLASDHATITNTIAPRAAMVDTAFVPGRLNILTAFMGTNDLMLLGLTGPQAYNAYAAYCAARVARGWTVIPFTMLPRQPRTNAYTVEWFEKQREAFNALVRANHLPLLADVAADPRIGAKYANLDWLYYFDQVHLTAAGASIVKDIVMLRVHQA